jgi:hypothetical protein
MPQAESGLVVELRRGGVRRMRLRMERNEMNRSCESGLPLFFTGLLAGVAVTLLLAPISGRGARRLIGRRVKEGEEWLKSKAAEVEEYAVNAGTAVRDRVRAATEPSTQG